MNEINSESSRRISPFKLAVALLIVLPLIFYLLYTNIDNPKIVNHGFGFGDVNGQENKGIRILDYRYNKRTPIAPADWQLQEGKIPQFNSIGTSEPPGDTLYVKWRVISTGKVYEDNVSLKERLPKDMNRKEIHFAIEGEKLNVYVISRHGHILGGAECPVKQYRDYGCDRIYPDYWKNY